MQKINFRKIRHALCITIVILLVSSLFFSSCGSTQTIQGEKGEKGEVGDAGEDGKTPYIGSNGNWWIDDLDTGVKASGEKVTKVTKVYKVFKAKKATRVTKVNKVSKAIKVIKVTKVIPAQTEKHLISAQTETGG